MNRNIVNPVRGMMGPKKGEDKNQGKPVTEQVKDQSKKAQEQASNTTSNLSDKASNMMSNITGGTKKEEVKKDSSGG